MFQAARNGRAAEQDIIGRAKSGDKQAFADLYNRYERRIYRICYGIVRDVSVAEDLTQETFLTAFRKLHTFRQDSLFTTWLHRVAVNACLMYVRKRNSTPTLVSYNTPQFEEEESNLDSLLGREDLATVGAVDRVTLLRVMEDLPPGYRMMVHLHDILGYEHHEIAELMGCTMGNTKSQLHKARLRLRDKLLDRTRETKTQVAAAPQKRAA